MSLFSKRFSEELSEELSNQEPENSVTNDIGNAVKRVEVALAMVLEERFQHHATALIRQHGPELTRRFLPTTTAFLWVALAGYGVIYECSSLVITYAWPGAFGAVLALLSHGVLFLSGVIFLLARQSLLALREPSSASEAHAALIGTDRR